MPSPPLVPDDGPIDIAHLQRMTLGDVSLEREVLAMFAAQAAGLVRALANSPDDAGALVPVSYTHLTLPTIYSV